ERPRATADLAEELGDVLLQVVLHSQIAQERGDFDLADVQDGLVRKIVRRHPHVFGDASAATTRDVQRNWEAIKAGERAAAGEGEKPKGALDGVSRGLPALSASRELQDRASAVGYDWPTLDGVRERGDFDLADVQDGLVRKIVRRHPHVFGDASAATTRDVQRNWEAIKAGERAAAGEGEKPKGALDGVSRGLPALSASRELQDRASAVGYDWPTLDGVRAKISEELAELDEALAEAGHPDQITSTQALSAATFAHAQEELGDVLAVIVNLGRRSGIDAEAALRGANDKFRRRFGEVERRAASRGISLKDADFTTLDALWDEAKAAEREAKG
ncbi:MAG: MazG family protein, partial [Chloroflexi bacterium]|nr:MazG family protein [Chloroflexota bacterium]